MMKEQSNQLQAYLHQLQPRRLMGRLTGPKVLINSVPKSGTNLLIRLLSLFPSLRSAGAVTGDVDDFPDILARVDALDRGEFLATHLWWTDSVATFLASAEIRGLFITRDPRDVCVSYYHYVMRRKQHWCHTYFTTVLQTNHERLMAVITGLDTTAPDGSPIVLRSVADAFRLRQPFLSHKKFLPITFESLIGPQGGGSLLEQRATLEKIAGHLGLTLSARRIDAILADTFSAESPTFRRGQIGSWQHEMTDDHRAAFKAATGDLLVDLGYETTLEW